mgnify:CR=1 FL=1
MKNTNEKGRDKENTFEKLPSSYDSKNNYNKNTYTQQTNTNTILNSNNSPSLPNNMTHHTIITSNTNTSNNTNNNNNQISTYPSVLHAYTKSNGNNSSTSNTISFNNNNINSSTDNLKVAIRIRPPLTREIEKNLPFRSIALANKEEHSCSLLEYIGAELDEGGRQKEWKTNPQMFQIHKFTFDEVFDIDSSQKDVYAISAKPAVNSVLEGYNSTIFAYGQTGTGKTFTMEGFTYNQFDEKRGIIPRTIEDIFTYIESNSNKDTKFIIRAAYLQIYNEMISDLLKPNNPNRNLNIREDKKKGLYVEHLSEWAVRVPSDIYSLLEKGASCREVSNTNMNDVSSRSHAVFMITVEQLISDLEINGRQITKIGRLNLVDLAGSERTRITGATGKQLEESKKINKSLSALGNVINALTDSKERKHIPYRDSKLTRLLENSLGGNCKTTMIATISPAQCSFNESLSTLNFAKRAKNIKNRPIVNEDIDHNALIHQYENELKKIKMELEEKSKLIASNEKILELKNKEEKAKNDAIKAYEQASKQLFIERDEKQKLEAKIRLMNLQMIKGGEKISIEETPQFKNALEEKKYLLEKDFEQKLLEIEKEREQIEDSKSQVEAYNKLLYQQRDIMNNLTISLKEKEDIINYNRKIISDLNKKILELNNILQLRNDSIEEMEKILDENHISHPKYSNMNLAVPIISSQISRNKIYIPYEAEQNGKEFCDTTLPLLTSEEKIKELNDIVSYKNKEISLLKKVSEKLFDNSNEGKNIKEKFKQLQEENLQLNLKITEKNQMINLQRQENESLEEHYNAMEQIYHRTEKENLNLINAKENFISCLDQIIKKLDNGLYNMDRSMSNYSENNMQNLRTDLVNIFQIVLNNNDDNEDDDNGKNNNNIYSYEDSNEINSNYFSNIIKNDLQKSVTNNNNSINKQKSNNNKNDKKISWKEIGEESYYKNSVKSYNTSVKFPMSSSRHNKKKENNVIHSHNESAGSEQQKNTNFKKDTNSIKNIKIKVMPKK